MIDYEKWIERVSVKVVDGSYVYTVKIPASVVNKYNKLLWSCRKDGITNVTPALIEQSVKLHAHVTSAISKILASVCRPSDLNAGYFVDTLCSWEENVLPTFIIRREK